MKPNTDEELVLAIQKGDISAYEELVRRYQQGLYVFIFRILHDDAASRDIVQDSLVKVYQIIQSIDIQKKFSTFLFEIAKNAALSVLRKRKRILSLDAISEIEEDESFWELYLRQDQQARVRNTVQSLEKKYTIVLSLYYFEDLSYEEIARKTQLPLNTVRTHIKRAKAEFKKHYIP
jgi:RNA polymerase sigma-70 factor (ECF subfamily)